MRASLILSFSGAIPIFTALDREMLDDHLVSYIDFLVM